MATVAMAQTEDDPPPMDDTVTIDTPVAAPIIEQPSVAPAPFLTLINPLEEDVEVPLETAEITIQGITLPGAVVSIDGNLIDTDDQGNFAGIATLDVGANEIEIVASNDQGDQVNNSIFVTRGE